ncbi:MAG: TlpA family protein disulfide reductase [Mycobacteriaceae bacterium]|nr:TlpA family protein disulfide reductase [Mycobacteriaceae bacterium]
MSTSTRWTVAVLVVVAGLIVALALQLREPSSHQPAPGTARSAGSGGSGAPAELRAAAGLPPCPAGASAGPTALHGISVQCAADGYNVDVARVVAGQAVVLNLWAYWCVPCRTELPAMAEYQKRAGPAVTVIAVHEDDNEVAALQLLTDLGVRLPTLQDGGRRVAAALHVPNVMPATVLLRADGSVAATLPQAFASADEIAAAVDQKLGVPQ